MPSPDIGPTDAALRKLFPLPLTPFEAYMVADDQPNYPMTFVVCVHFEGRVESDTFRAALAIALARSPLLTARLAEHDRQPLNWVVGDSTMVLDFAPGDEPLEGGCFRPIDLRREPGLRAWVRAGNDTSRVYLQIHHACSDGVGAAQFIEDMLVAYSNQYDGGGPALRPIDVSRLARRGHFDIPQRSFGESLLDLWITIREACHMLFVARKPLATPGRNRDGQGAATDGEEFIEHTFSRDVSKRLRQAARQQRVSLNDVMIRDLLLVIRDWNWEQRGANRRGRLCINMPTSLRSRDDRTMPSANLMSFAFVTRKVSACDAPAELLSSIREETQATIKHRFTLYFLGMLGAASSLGILKRSLRGDRCLSTAVLTNMGDPTRRFVAQLPRRDGMVTAGNLTMTKINGIPPIRHLTRAAFSLTEIGRRITVSLRCDPFTFSRDDTQRLLAMYAARLAKSAD